MIMPHPESKVRPRTQRTELKYNKDITNLSSSEDRLFILVGFEHVTGFLALAYAMYCTCRRVLQLKMSWRVDDSGLGAQEDLFELQFLTSQHRSYLG